MRIHPLLKLATVLAVVSLLWASTAQSQELPKTVAEAQRMERAVALPLTPLYSTPVVSGKSKPGDLLAQEPYSGYLVPPGVKVVRIVYDSQDAEGHDVATSAVILTPPGPAPKDGWPEVSPHGARRSSKPSDTIPAISARCR